MKSCSCKVSLIYILKASTLVLTVRAFGVLTSFVELSNNMFVVVDYTKIGHSLVHSPFRVLLPEFLLYKENARESNCAL